MTNSENLDKSNQRPQVENWNSEERLNELKTRKFKKERINPDQRAWHHMPTGEMRILTLSEYLEERREWIEGGGNK